MQVLLLQPEDSPENGPWSRQRWDLIIDLGKSSQFSQERWSRRFGCPVWRIDSFRQELADARRVRQIFSSARGRLIDEEGIDWWELMSVLIAAHALDVIALRVLAKEISPSAELWATRSGGVAGILAVVLNSPVRNFRTGALERSATRAMHLAGVVRRFSVAQIKQIFLDKYDAGYQWRSRFAARGKPCAEPVVLLPSAYENVSRMAAAYARLLPEQPFLMVATRQSARQFVPPANVQVRDLAAYAKADSAGAEATGMIERWMNLREDLKASPDLQTLLDAGLMDSFPSWIRDGLGARNAWREVLQHETVQAVLCGDDTNLYTRLPVELAVSRKIPTLNFHHGALDGRYLFKELPSDLYLAKNEMERDYLLRVCGLPPERVLIGAPSNGEVRSITSEAAGPIRSSVIFFSEPYEIAGMRADQVYLELLPALCSMARESGHGLIVKLHPFESLSQRRRIIRGVLSAEDRKLVRVVDGPLTTELMAQAWFGITGESTTVVDCLQNGVCCFLCQWLALSPYQYVQQYARFGVGEVLEEAPQLAEIPSRLAVLRNRPAAKTDFSTAEDAAILQRCLTRSCDSLDAKSAS